MKNENAPKNLENYFLDRGYSDLAVFNDEIGQYLSNARTAKTFEGNVTFTKNDINYSELSSNLKGLQKGWDYIGKRVKREDRKINGSFWEKFGYTLMDFFVPKENKSLETLLGNQKTDIASLSTTLEKSNSNYKKYFNSLNAGFSNQCYSWIKADSLINKYGEENVKYDGAKENLGLFSFLSSAKRKEKKQMKNKISMNEEKIKTLKNKMEEIQNSFETYKILFNKNELDKLFLSNLDGELKYHNQLLGFSGDSVIDIINQSGHSLDSLKALKRYSEINEINFTPNKSAINTDSNEVVGLKIK